MKTALILAGGLGKRLRPLTYRVPKSLIKIAGKPVLMWQLELLKKHGITDIIILAGYKAGAIIDHIGDGSRLGLNISYSIEDEPLGTGGAIKKAFSLIKDEIFYVLNGDIITDLDLTKLEEMLIKTGSLAAIAAVPLVSTYGVLVIEKDRIVSFKEKPVFEDLWMNAGVYAMKREVESYLPNRGNLEELVFPSLAQKGLLAVVKYRDVFWRSLDSHKDMEELEKQLSAMRLL